MLPQTPSIVETQGLGALAGISRWAARSAKLVGVAGLITLLASSGTAVNAAENSLRMAQERHACAVVLGLDPSARGYDTCIRSLERSLAAWDQEQAVQRDRRACAESGLEPGTSAFAVCVVNGGQSPTSNRG
jgi:hypothetical protein